MSNIRVLFSTQQTNPVSRIIRWFTKSRVSHATLLYFDTDWGGDFVMEATEGGVKITPFLKFSAKNDLVRIFTPKQPLDAGLTEAANNWLGDQFDYIGLLGMILVYLGHIFRMTWRNPFASPHAMFCSEFVARVLKWSEYPGTEDMDPTSVSPEDLLEFFERENAKA